MLFNSYTTFFCILIFIVVFSICKFVCKNNFVNQLFLLVGNCLILTTIVSPRSLLLISILAVLIFFVGFALQKKDSNLLLSISLIVLIAGFSLRNYPLVQTMFGEWWLSMKKHVISIEKIGLSYMLFRMIHWLVESNKHTLRSANFLSFINYLFFFPTFLAGPIDTYNNFDYWMNKTHLKFNLRMFFAGIGRILYGAAKTLLIVPFIKPYAVNYETLIPNLGSVGAICTSAIIYSFYIYIDFSGYCDIAIGMAYMLGVKTPENFNNPYLATNISDFWKRWHITFSSFLKIYVFKPIINLINRTFLKQYRLFVSVVAYILTFLVCGIWHGSTLNFLLWGIWHGVGLSIYKIFSRNKNNGDYSKVKCAIATFTTFVFVTIGWIFFNYSIEQLSAIVNILFL